MLEARGSKLAAELARRRPVVRILIVSSMPTFAAIDIGSNSVRLKIARLQAGRLKEVHEDREVTRLGEGVFSGGLLSPEAMSEPICHVVRDPCGICRPCMQMANLV